MYNCLLKNIVTHRWKCIPQLQTQTSVYQGGLKKTFSDPTRAHGLLDHGKERKHASKWEWTEREYHAQDRKYLPHISVKMSCATTQFPALSFFCPHAKPHGVRGVSKNYHLRLDPKLCHITCAILWIPCAYILSTTMLYKPCEGKETD